MADAACCPVKTHSMEPRAARLLRLLRRRAGPRGEQEDPPSKDPPSEDPPSGGEPPSGSSGSSGGIGGGDPCGEGAPAVQLQSFLLSWVASAPNCPAGRGRRKGTLRAVALPCLSDSTSEGEWSSFLFPGYHVSSKVTRLPACQWPLHPGQNNFFLLPHP